MTGTTYYFDPEVAAEDSFLISSLMSDLLRARYDDMVYRIIRDTEVPGYWEACLAREIEYRSVRARSRRLVARLRPSAIRYRASVLRDRLATAKDVLRGNHWCDE